MVFSARFNEHNTKINIEGLNKYMIRYSIRVNLASDPEEQDNLDLHIIQNK